MGCSPLLPLLEVGQDALLLGKFKMSHGYSYFKVPYGMLRQPGFSDTLREGITVCCAVLEEARSRKAQQPNVLGSVSRLLPTSV